MNCKVHIRRIKDIPVLKIFGDIKKEHLNKITSKLNLLKKSNSQVVIVDLSNTGFIDSYGLGVFLHIWHEFAQDKRDMVFLKPQGFIKELLAETSLSKVFRIIESEEDI